MLHLLPHTTLRCLRQLLRDELGLVGGDALVLRRAALRLTARPDGSAKEEDKEDEDIASCPLPSTQNHKLAYPFFLDPTHVLVVERCVWNVYIYTHTHIYIYTHLYKYT